MVLVGSQPPEQAYSTAARWQCAQASIHIVMLMIVVMMMMMIVTIIMMVSVIMTVLMITEAQAWPKGIRCM